MRRLLFGLGLLTLVLSVCHIPLKAQTTYYLRADGTAAKAAATSCSSAATAMSIATHDAETFTAGDTIVLCDDGGTYRDQLDVPSSGSAGSPITYQAESGDSPVISGASIETTWVPSATLLDSVDNEEGDLSDWDTTVAFGGGTITAHADAARTGSFGTKCSGTGSSTSYGQNDYLAATEVYHLFYFSINNVIMADGDQFHLHSNSAGGAYPEIQIRRSGANYQVDAGGGGWNTIVKANWQKVLWHMGVGGTNNRKVYLNDVEIFSGVGAISSTHVKYGFMWGADAGTSGDLYIDDAVVYTAEPHANLYVKAVGYDAGLVIEDGAPLDFVAWDTDLATTYATMAQGSFTFDTGGAQTVYIWSSDDADPDTHTIEVAERNDCIYANGKDYITVEDIICEGGRRNGIEVQTGDNWIIDNVTVRYIGGVFSGGAYIGDGIVFHTSSDNNIIRNCTAYEVLDFCYSTQVFGAGLTLTNTTFSNLTGYNCGGGGIGVLITEDNSTLSGTVISGATIYNSGLGYSGDRNAHGVHIYAGAGTTGSVISGTTITNSSIYNNVGGGIWMHKDSGDVTVTRTSIHDNTEEGINALDADNPTTTELILYTSLIYGNTRDGLIWNVNNGGGITLYNNTFYNNGNDGTTTYNAHIVINTDGNELVENNIFYGVDSYALYDQWGIWAGANQNFNIFYRAAGNLVYFNSTAYTVAQFANYQAASGQDANSRYINPQCTDAADGDFTLLPGSPAINAGTDVGLGGQLDIAGHYIPTVPGAVDIGAYEAQYARRYWNTFRRPRKRD